MSDIAINVDAISKQYRIGRGNQCETLRDSLADALSSPFRRAGKLLRGQHTGAADLDEIFWALRDISFQVKHGEVVGIVGRNGAGKSTLLKILSRITEPTEGKAEIHGRVGSLLEVGTGFHQELTGRENIYLNGIILGMKRAEISRKFDEIVDFSGIEKFIDTPVKHYSSGMSVRLAFAVAAHLEPEILLVDEVLAVGDIAFQKKCLGKMGDIARGGRTVLFVSHNMGAVEHLCQRGILLEDGKVAFSGGTKETIDHYVNSVSEKYSTSRSHIFDLSNAGSRPSKYRARPMLKGLELFTGDDVPLTGGLPVGASLKAHVHFELAKPTSTVDACLSFDNLLGQTIFLAHSLFQPNRPTGKWAGKQTFVCEIPSLTLAPGEYKIQAFLGIGHEVVDHVEEAAPLTIVEADYYGTGKRFGGLIVLKHHWSLKQISDPPQRFEISVGRADAILGRE